MSDLTKYLLLHGSEIDQLFKICCVLGTPDLTSFPEGTNISRLYEIISYEKVNGCNDWYLDSRSHSGPNFYIILLLDVAGKPG